MNNTVRFRTKTIIRPRENAAVGGKWPIGIDVGYSGVKLFSPNKVVSFPAYAERLTNTDTIGELNEEYILFRDYDTDEFWLVGQNAQNNISDTDTTVTEESSYSRNRFRDPIFRVCLLTGLGIALMPNAQGTFQYNYSDEDIYVRTGLPAKYMQSYEIKAFQDLVSGHHHLSLKIGKGDPVELKFYIQPDHISVIEQPKGTLFSIALKNNGGWVENGREILSKNVVIFDAGFNTLDLFPFKNHKRLEMQTDDRFGMRAVLHLTCDKIAEKYGTSISVPAIQKYLTKGKIRAFNPIEFSSTEEPFDDLLEESCSEVCQKALDWMNQILQIQEFDLLVITGGTGAAWSEQIHKYYSRMNTLQVVDGSINDNLPMIFANVRGYYLSLLSEIRKG